MRRGVSLRQGIETAPKQLVNEVVIFFFKQNNDTGLGDFWSEFASAYAAQVHSLCASVTAVYLPFFVFGRVLTRLD